MPQNEQTISPSVEPVAFEHGFSSAEAAFDAGNYVVAFDMAADGSEIRAAARIMCGDIEAGSAALDVDGQSGPQANLAAVFGAWYRGERPVELGSLVGVAPIDVVLFTMPGSTTADGFDQVDGFRTVAFCLEPEQFGLPFKDIATELPADFTPAFGLCFDAYGPYIPDAIDFPLVYWVGDHDYFFSTRYRDLENATVILVNSGEEQCEISNTYNVRTATLPAYEKYDALRPAQGVNRAYDILFTGRAFVPYMGDKARSLFRLATMEESDLTIRIIDDYLSPDAYQSALQRARFVPIYWRYAGGIQTRAIDALLSGAGILSPEEGMCAPLLGAAAPRYKSLVSLDRKDIVLITDGEDDPVETECLVELFLPSPKREERLLKFTALQVALAGGERKRKPVERFPVELRGYDQQRGVRTYNAIIKGNVDRGVSAAAANSNAAAALYQAILLQTNDRATQIAYDLSVSAISQYPDNLMLRFNGACALWTLGQHDEARPHFRDIATSPNSFTYDPRHDAILSHRIRQLAEMMPYGDYYRAAVHERDIAVQIVQATALTYLGRYEGALECYRDHPAAWRLWARTLHDADGDRALCQQAFYAAVNLYPPSLAELLDVGIAVEQALGDEEAAAAIFRKWVLFVERTRDAKGARKYLMPAALELARANRSYLSDWTGELLDRMIAEAN